MIRAILFDLDGTLFDRATTVERFVSDQYRRLAYLFDGVTQRTYVSRFIELDQRGYVRKEIVYQQIGDDFRLPDDAPAALFDDFCRGYHRHAVSYPETKEVLDVLSSEGLALGLITNGGESHQRATIDALRIGPYFQSILISEAEGLRKPDPRIFERGLQQLGVAASEAVYVGDHPEVDIVGARAAGMWSVWRRDDHWGECPSAHAVLKDLSSLPLLLTQVPWASPA